MHGCLCIIIQIVKYSTFPAASVILVLMLFHRSALEVIYLEVNVMRYINLRFTYLLIYLMKRQQQQKQQNEKSLELMQLLKATTEEAETGLTGRFIGSE